MPHVPRAYCVERVAFLQVRLIREGRELGKANFRNLKGSGFGID